MCLYDLSQGVYIYLVSYLQLLGVMLACTYFSCSGSMARPPTHQVRLPIPVLMAFLYISLFMTNVGLFKTQGLVRVYTGKNIYIPFSHIAATFILLKITN